QLEALYARPEDRPFDRDYDEGQPVIGSASPEALVYFGEVLTYYLEHRPSERLLREPAADESLGRVLARVPDRRSHQRVGVEKNLPVFVGPMRRRMTYPLAWRAGRYARFAHWRQ